MRGRYDSGASWLVFLGLFLFSGMIQAGVFSTAVFKTLFILGLLFGSFLIIFCVCAGHLAKKSDRDSDQMLKDIATH